MVHLDSAHGWSGGGRAVSLAQLGGWILTRLLGYELARGSVGNPLISRTMSRTVSNCRFFRSGPTHLSFEDVSEWYGSRTGADDLWVLPKAPAAPSRSDQNATTMSGTPATRPGPPAPRGRPARPPCRPRR